MAIDPELKELAADLRAIARDGRAAAQGASAARGAITGDASGFGSNVGAVSLRSGGHARDSFSGRTMFAGESWRQQKRDVRDVADVIVGAARGDYKQVAQGITGLAPKSLLKGFLAVQAIRYGIDSLMDGINAVTEERNRKRDLIAQANQAGLLTSAMDINALQDMYLEKQMGKMGRWDLNAISPGVIRDSITVPFNFLGGFLGLHATTSDQIREGRDEASKEALSKSGELKEKYYSQARLGNLVAAFDSSLELGALVGPRMTNKFADDVGSPAEVWYRYDQAKVANRLWSATESPRAGQRSEVD